MTKPTIVVTGAAGKTGSAVVAQLRQKEFPVRAIVRSSDARSARLARLGAEIVIADLANPDQMFDALKGAQRGYFCPPFDPFMIQSAVTFALAAREANLESIVGLTQWLSSESHPSLSTRQHWLADQLFATIQGIDFTIVAPGLFADMPYLSVIEFAAQLGLYPMPAPGETRNAPPSAEDIARVSVAALIDPHRHAGKTYRPTGPRLLSITEMATILGRVLNRSVRHVNIPMWMFNRAAAMDGFDPFLLSGLKYYVQDLKAGAFEFGAPTSHVLDVTGQPAEDFETVARRHAGQPKAARTMGRTLRAFARFMTVPFRPGFDGERYERVHRFPRARQPALAMDNAHWRSDRAAVVANNVTAMKMGARA